MSGRVIVLRGDAAHLPLPDGSVDLIVTSPPYFGLRSYTDAGQAYGGQIGSEYTPHQYLEALWNCTRDWMRALKPGGSIFVNLGDKYSTYTGANWGNGRSLDGHRGQRKVPDGGPVNAPDVYGIPYKSLMGLPWRYVLGCIGTGSALDSSDVVKLLLRDVALGVCTLADAEQIVDELAATPGPGLGLVLRAEIIWSKTNGMPESANDRVRRSHEQVFHLVKPVRRYFSAIDEIREPHADVSLARTRRAYNAGDQFSVGTPNTLDPAQFCNPLGKLPGSVWNIASQPLVVPAHLGVDHFAAFPTALVKPIILGWSPPEICTECGEGRRPVALRSFAPQPDVSAARNMDHGSLDASSSWGSVPRGSTTRTITGYACACPDASAPTRPALVADPFGGTGTTALVASVLGRNAVTVDRSADYCRLARWRTADPAERARALGVPKPPPVPEDQGSLFDLDESA